MSGVSSLARAIRADRESVDRPFARAIITEVAAAMGQRDREVLSAAHAACLVRARQVSMAMIATARPDMSYPAIGRMMGRDHTTVIWAIDRVIAMLGGARRIRSRGPAGAPHVEEGELWALAERLAGSAWRGRSAGRVTAAEPSSDDDLDARSLAVTLAAALAIGVPPAGCAGADAPPAPVGRPAPQPLGTAAVVGSTMAAVFLDRPGPEARARRAAIEVDGIDDAGADRGAPVTLARAVGLRPEAIRPGCWPVTAPAAPDWSGGGPVLFVAALSRHCQWPMWADDTPAEDRRVCGRARERGSYCRDHAALAYVAVEGRRRGKGARARGRAA